MFADEADFQEDKLETQMEAVVETTFELKKRKRDHSEYDVDGIKIKRKKQRYLYSLFLHVH